MATIYAPGSSQGTYVKKLTAMAQAQNVPVNQVRLPGARPAAAPVAPAAAAVGGDPYLNSEGIPQGTMTMGPTGSFSNGGGFMQATVAPGQSAGGGGDRYFGQDVNTGVGGPTIYAPPSMQQAPAAPTLNANKPAFMTQQLQGYTQVIPKSPTAAGGAGGAAGGSFNQASPQQVQAIVDLLSGQMGDANAANEGRYQQLLQGADQLGQTQMQANQRQTTQTLANSAQSLTNRGLGNSTIVDTTNRGILQDQAQNNMATQQAVTQNKQGIIERRTDQAPDLGLYAQLLSQPGGAAIAAALLKATQKKAK